MHIFGKTGSTDGGGIAEDEDGHDLWEDVSNEFPNLFLSFNIYEHQAELCYIPDDYGITSPFVTSGIRIGTPAITTRGMKESEMAQIIDMIDRLIMNPDDEAVIAAVKAEVHALAKRFPLYATEGVLH